MSLMNIISTITLIMLVFTCGQGDEECSYSQCMSISSRNVNGGGNTWCSSGDPGFSIQNLPTSPIIAETYTIPGSDCQIMLNKLAYNESNQLVEFNYEVVDGDCCFESVQVSWEGGVATYDFLNRSVPFGEEDVCLRSSGCNGIDLIRFCPASTCEVNSCLDTQLLAPSASPSNSLEPTVADLGYDHSKWTLIFGVGIFTPKAGREITDSDELKSLVQLKPNQIVRRLCLTCSETSHKDVYYRRVTPIPSGLEFVSLFKENWFSCPGNELNVDFHLYSTYQDALNDENRWNYCNYNQAGVGFPRECGPSGKVANQWNNFKEASPSGSHYGFFMEVGDGLPGKEIQVPPNKPSITYFDEQKWRLIFGKGKLAPTSNAIVSSNTFKALLAGKPNQIIRRICPFCREESHQDIYYRRITPIPSSIDLLDLFKDNWRSCPGNYLGRDFHLYSSYTDALNDENRWLYCNYNQAGVGFPRECGPFGNVANQWNSFELLMSPALCDFGFLVENGDGESGTDLSSQIQVATDFFEQSEWSFVFGGGLFGENPNEVSSSVFNDLVSNSHYQIIRRVCPYCSEESHRDIFYRRITPIPDEMDFLDLLRDNWESGLPGQSAVQGNQMGLDFQLYSTFADAINDTNHWKYCYYYGFGTPGIGFPGNCGPVGEVSDQWNSSIREDVTNCDFGFLVYTGPLKSVTPTYSPSSIPTPSTVSPSYAPSSFPSNFPSSGPSIPPTKTKEPSIAPSSLPSPVPSPTPTLSLFPTKAVVIPPEIPPEDAGYATFDHKAWKLVFGRGIFIPHPSREVTDDAMFKALFKLRPNQIVRRLCPTCQSNSHKDIYYRRITPIPDNLDFMDLFKNNWSACPANHLNYDFAIYSTYEDALNDTNRWKYCNFNVGSWGFPRNCGPNGHSAHNWNSFRANYTPPSGEHFGFFVEAGVGSKSVPIPAPAPMPPAYDSNEWRLIFGRHSFTPDVNEEITSDGEFKELMNLRPNQIVRRVCPFCRSPAHRDIYYRRISPIPSSLNFLDLFQDNWKSHPGNIHNVDFALYSTYQDALNDKNRWAFCNYNYARVGFPYDCGPTGRTGGQWGSFNWGYSEACDIGFLVEKGNGGQIALPIFPEELPKATDYYDTGNWTVAFGSGRFADPDNNLSDPTEFQKLIENQATPIIRRVCPYCYNPDHQDIYYRRFSAVPNWLEFVNYFRYEWRIDFNYLGIDFGLYHSLWGAIEDENRWGYCDYPAGAGFPGQCGPSRRQPHIWSKFGQPSCPASEDFFFLVYTGPLVGKKHTPPPPPPSPHPTAKYKDINFCEKKDLIDGPHNITEHYQDCDGGFTIEAHHLPNDPGLDTWSYKPSPSCTLTLFNTIWQDDNLISFNYFKDGNCCFSEVDVQFSTTFINYKTGGASLLSCMGSKYFPEAAVNGKVSALERVHFCPCGQSRTAAPSISFIPSYNPSLLPSSQPSSIPSKQPSKWPSHLPSILPSSPPSSNPSSEPSTSPVVKPSAIPSSAPSKSPSTTPSIIPSSKPSLMPSSAPSERPSKEPSIGPSISILPSRNPSSSPSFMPSSTPSKAPKPVPIIVNYCSSPSSLKTQLVDGPFDTTANDALPTCSGGFKLEGLSLPNDPSIDSWFFAPSTDCSITLYGLEWNGNNLVKFDYHAGAGCCFDKVDVKWATSKFSIWNSGGTPTNTCLGSKYFPDSNTGAISAIDRIQWCPCASGNRRVQVETGLRDRGSIISSQKSLQLASSTFSLNNNDEWTLVFGLGTYQPEMEKDISDTQAFVDLVEGRCNKIVRRICDSCSEESHRNIYYKRITPIPASLNFLELFKSQWVSCPGNILNIDFRLYSSYEDAVNDTNRWNYCNYNKAGVGFPRECGPTSKVTHQWNSFELHSSLEENVGFFVEGPGCHGSSPPTTIPTNEPSSAISGMPSAAQSVVPSFNPSVVPSHLPTKLLIIPSSIPSTQPSSPLASDAPSNLPSAIPSSLPSTISSNSYYPTKTRKPSVPPSVTFTPSTSKNPSAFPSESMSPSTVRNSLTPTLSPSELPQFVNTSGSLSCSCPPDQSGATKPKEYGNDESIQCSTGDKFEVHTSSSSFSRNKSSDISFKPPGQQWSGCTLTLKNIQWQNGDMVEFDYEVTAGDCCIEKLDVAFIAERMTFDSLIQVDQCLSSPLCGERVSRLQFCPISCSDGGNGGSEGGNSGESSQQRKAIHIGPAVKPLLAFMSVPTLIILCRYWGALAFFMSEATTFRLVPIGAYYDDDSKHYSSFLVSCYNSQTKAFQGVSKIDAGFDDEDLKELSKRMEGSKIEDKSLYYDVSACMECDAWFEPNLVWEIECEGLFLFRHSKAGVHELEYNGEPCVGLRYPRFKRVLEKLTPLDISTCDELIDCFEQQQESVNDGNEKLSHELRNDYLRKESVNYEVLKSSLALTEELQDLIHKKKSLSSELPIDPPGHGDESNELVSITMLRNKKKRLISRGVEEPSGQEKQDLHTGASDPLVLPTHHIPIGVSQRNKKKDIVDLYEEMNVDVSDYRSRVVDFTTKKSDSKYKLDQIDENSGLVDTGGTHNESTSTSEDCDVELGNQSSLFMNILRRKSNERGGTSSTIVPVDPVKTKSIAVRRFININRMRSKRTLMDSSGTTEATSLSSELDFSDMWSSFRMRFNSQTEMKSRLTSQ